MSFSILTNMSAMTTANSVSRTRAGLTESMESLSSGLRVNRSAQGPSALGLSENLRADIRSTSQAERNAVQAVSISQVAEGALGEIQSALERMRELSIQSANGVLGLRETGYIHQEFVELRQEIDRIVAVTEFNGQLLLDGSFASGMVLHIGIHGSTNDEVRMSIATLGTSGLGNSGGLAVGSASLSTATNARLAMESLENAINDLSMARAKIGAVQNRVRVTRNVLEMASHHLTDADSRIRDADIAKETAEYTRKQVLLNAGLSMLGQTREMSRVVLSLIGV